MKVLNSPSLNSLMKLETAEIEYKKLYVANPYDNFKPVSTWQAFADQYRAKMKNPVKFPDQPLSDIRPRFFESEFFSQTVIHPEQNGNSNSKLIYPPHLNSEIVVFKHLRYLPIMEHTLEFVKISYVLNGHCKFFLNGKTYDLEQGDLVIVPPNLKQAFFCNADDDIVVNIIMRRSSFEDAFSPLLMEQNDISNFFLRMLYRREFSQLVLVHCDNDKEIEHIIFGLYMESQASMHGSQIILNSYVLLLFGQIIRNHADDATILEGNIDEQPVSNIIQYIRVNRKDVNLESLAQHFNLSEGHISRFIKRETGYSFSQLLRDIKMREAAKLLISTKMSIEEIIDKVGYTDVSHFYKNFKKIFGVTPAEYRQKGVGH
ncbi:AraC family transcriptional regulator [Lentilactobacillus buchneri]|uniref:AraC family transcriptional regulator n=1 Tax=Lentilactobacillus buchneri TaxID=1581 RepID=UPI00298C3A74|nr:AraC family transcriptional regulator [Lentilactobacillus buchneri]